MRKYSTQPLVERFWAKVDQRSGDECWPWLGATYPKPDNYGFIYGGPKRPRFLRAHRVAYELAVGKIPRGKCICHTCDNQLCCNPAHLWIGTRGDNNRDRGVKGRTAPQHGENGGFAKLTNEQVLAIRSRYAAGGISQEQLGKEYGIQQPHVSRLVRRQNWTRI